MSNKYLYRSHISEPKFRGLTKLSSVDLNAAQMSRLPGLGRNSTNKILLTLRAGIAEPCEREKQPSIRLEKRVIWLLELQERRFRTRKGLSVHLNISTRTQERWVQKHVTTGIDGLLSDRPKNIKPGIITPEIHEGLSKRMNSSDNPFLGHWDAMQWVLSQYGVEVKYHLLRYHLIQHFKTKLKSPRKSRHKKDEKAVNAFLKTSHYTERHWIKPR